MGGVYGKNKRRKRNAVRGRSRYRYRGVVEIKTKQSKEYKTAYYKQHRDRYNQLYLVWCKDNPKSAKAIRDRWLAKNPHYQRDYQRKRKAATEPLIFQFLDNGFGSDIDGYISYLRSRGIPEQHIKWFKVDVRKHLEEA